MRFILSAGQETSITVQLEPSGVEYTVNRGDYLIVEWPDGGEGSLLGGIDHSPNGLVVSEPQGGMSRIWNSNGKELSILG
ncbi:hypothetical protein [Streptomyces sp. NPDC051567]|uniref:hypothetical protein n=1 Tax=Streptomyces sp. NPDC051567 TaxID=3365660 RepID=UPI00379174F3